MITGAIGVYLLEVSLLLILLYIFNKLFLGGETLHSFNRFLWLSILVISFAVPYFAPLSLSSVTTEAGGEALELGEITIEVITTEPSQPLISFEMVVKSLLWIYSVGVLLVLLYYIFAYGSLMRLIFDGRYNIVRHNRPEDRHFIALAEECEAQIGFVSSPRYVVHDYDIAPFSWFGFIAISRADLELSGREILLHELSHTKQLHSLDTLVANAATAILWFNPAVWLTRRALQQVHEYCADEEVLSSGVDAKRYQLLLIRKAVGSRLYSVSNSLNHSNLKERITMMLKKKSSRMVAAKCFYVIPVIFCAMAIFASPALAKHRSAITGVKITNYFDNNQIEEQLSPLEEVERSILFYVNGLEVSDIKDIDHKDISSIEIIKRDNPEWKSLKAWESHDENNYQGVVTIKIMEDIPEGTKTYAVNGKIITEEEFKKLDPDKVGELTVVKGSSSYQGYQEGDRSQTLVVTKRDETKEQTPPDDQTFLRVETMPKFQGGDLTDFRDWLMERLRYPKEAAEQNIQGSVLLSFVIDTDGSLVNLEVMRSPNELLSNEALRLVKLSNGEWTPGEQSGKKVRVKHMMPIIFKLSNE